jgi:renalase
MTTIAIIGAGLAGAAAGRSLQEAGHQVALFDKGRGPGGRMSTRRMETALGTVRLDHGAQFFTVRGEGLTKAVAGWAAAGACAPWQGKLIKIGADGTSEPLGGDDRYVGVGGMNQVVKAALEGLDARFGRQVLAIEGGPGAWVLRFAEGEREGPFEVVLVAVPAEQTGPLISDWVPHMAREAEAVRSAPCWAAMAVFDSPVEADFDAARLETGPLSWISRETSKPGRGGPEAWVLHGSPAWSKTHLEETADEVAQALLTAFADHASFTTPISLTAHRWRYAQIETPAATGFGLSEDLGLGVCGDWRLGPRIEFAYRSGAALADAIML